MELVYLALLVVVPVPLLILVPDVLKDISSVMVLVV